MRLLKKISDIFFPNVCPICEKIIAGEDIVCADCKKSVPIIKEPKCQKCGKQLINDESLYCEDCTENRHCFDRGVCIFEYKNELKQSLYKFKYKNKRCFGEFYGSIGICVYGGLLKQWNIELIVPVPMYNKKRKKRGYNQATVFGEFLSSKTGIALDDRSLVRIRNTKAQKGLNKDERYNNLKNAFALDKSRLKNVSNVLLVDDIYTTGSTVNECASLLKAAGVKRVYFMCIASGRV
jgi:ComF family protein